MLKFDGSWRFHSPGKIAAQGRKRQRALEHFKSTLAKAAGSTSSWSSNASWAETHLLNYMQHAAGMRRSSSRPSTKAAPASPPVMS